MRQQVFHSGGSLTTSTRRRVAIFFLFLFAIGAAQPALAQWTLSVGTAPGHAERQASEDIFERFFGVPLPDSEREAFFAIPNGRVFELGYRFDLPKRSSLWDFEVTAALGHLTRAYTLENGISVFIDPARVELRGAFARAELAAARPLRRSRPEGVALDVALGAVVGRYHASVRSATLNVQTKNWSSSGYLRGGVRVPLYRAARSTTYFDTHLHLYDRDTADLAFRLALEF